MRRSSIPFPALRRALRRDPLRARRRASAESALDREIARLQRHFRDVLAELCARDVSHLAPAQRSTRARLIDELRRYARRGRFPRNLDFPGARVPYFVDAFGTRCAMAHLIESTGAAALVARVAATRNNALVPELAGDPELVAWLDEAGLTAAEAARIQPSYCFVTKAQECVCSEGTSVDAVAEVTVLSATTDGEDLARVDAVHGDMSLVAVGDEIQFRSEAGVDATLLVGVSAGEMEPSYGPIYRMSGNLVAQRCSLDEVPPLQKADLIDALLSDDCAASLASKDEVWGESICEDGEDGGCSACAIGAAGAPPSAWPMALLAVAALLSRRRRSAPRRRRTRRMRA